MIAIALNTVAEIVRRRFAIAALLATLGIAVLSAWGFSSLHNLRHHPGNAPLTVVEIKSIAAVLTILVAYLFSFVLAFAATLVASPMLATEVDSGVLLPVLARPVSRAAVVAGKFLGLGFVLCTYAAFAASLEFAVIHAFTQYMPPHPAAAIAALAALSLTMLALTLAIGTRLPMIAASIVSLLAFGIVWMAGIIASIGPFYHNDGLIRMGAISELALPTDAMWRLAVFHLEPAVVLEQARASGAWQGPFFVTAPPPLPVTIWTACWIVAVVAIAARSFATRDV